jgi:hypothetical protein
MSEILHGFPQRHVNIAGISVFRYVLQTLTDWIPENPDLSYKNSSPEMKHKQVVFVRRFQRKAFVSCLKIPAFNTTSKVHTDLNVMPQRQPNLVFIFV